MLLSVCLLWSEGLSAWVLWVSCVAKRWHLLHLYSHPPNVIWYFCIRSWLPAPGSECIVPLQGLTQLMGRFIFFYCLWKMILMAQTSSLLSTSGCSCWCMLGRTESRKRLISSWVCVFEDVNWSVVILEDTQVGGLEIGFDLFNEWLWDSNALSARLSLCGLCELAVMCVNCDAPTKVSNSLHWYWRPLSGTTISGIPCITFCIKLRLLCWTYRAWTIYCSSLL